MNTVNIYKSFFKNYNLSINDSMYLFLENENDNSNIFKDMNMVLTPVGINYDQVSKSVYEIDMSVKVRVSKDEKNLVNIDVVLGNYVYMDANSHKDFINQLYLEALPDIYKILVKKINNNLVKSNLGVINFPTINFKSYHKNALGFLNNKLSTYSRFEAEDKQEQS